MPKHKGGSGRVKDKNRHGSKEARIRNTIDRKAANVRQSSGEIAYTAYSKDTGAIAGRKPTPVVKTAKKVAAPAAAA